MPRERSRRREDATSHKKPPSRVNPLDAAKPVPQRHDRHPCFLFSTSRTPSRHQAIPGPEKLSEDPDEYDYFDYAGDLEQLATATFNIYACC
ncbi:hypothetical protein U9M48_037820 [Paspalum notatum var. saurae]|uniref:Uncharacterized protein n=1 Tax=Paspalum notatum var. saurae TaxID=547442 RepID=A0AAQ3UFV4_PASNO